MPPRQLMTKHSDKTKVLSETNLGIPNTRELFNKLMSITSRILLTLDSIGGSPPASISNILKCLTSLRRLATTLPAVPPPTIMKSKDW